MTHTTDACQPAARWWFRWMGTAAPAIELPDLARLGTRVATRYLPDIRRMPLILWRLPPRTVKHEATMGEYRFDRKIVFINLVLAQKWVPRYVLESALHHELCHHLQAERWIEEEKHHSPRFREWEAMYPRHLKAEQWLARHSDRFDRESNKLAA